MQTAEVLPRRVLMTADPVGGVWTFALELCRALEPYGIHVGLATMGAPLSAEQRDELGRCKNVRLFESTYALEWMDDPWKEVDLAGDWLLRIAAKFRPELIHLNGYAHAALPWRRPVLITAHSCVLSWWRTVKGEPAPSTYAEYARQVRAGLAAADFVVAPTAAMRAALVDEYGLALDAGVIPNAISHGFFAPAVKEPFIFALGRAWDEAKNLRALDEVAASVRWPVYIAGDTMHPAGSAFQFTNAIALGKLSRAGVAGRLGRAAVFAWPARYEPFGLAPLEAALCSCALVLGDIPSLREIWNGAATFVPPNDRRALAAALKALIDRPTAREELGLRARARALQFSPTKMGAGYVDAYRACLARRAVEVAA